MKTASVRELRNHYNQLLRWVEAGEEVVISKRGIVVARLVPEKKSKPRKVDWSTSAAVMRDRSDERILSAEESAMIINENRGKW